MKHDLRRDGYTGDVELLPLADFHVGDPNCDKKLIKRLLAWVMDDAHRYVVLNGDLMNTAITSSVSDSYDETLTPGEQLDRCIALFGPLAREGRILGVTGGNHEARIAKSVGVDMTSLMCAQLGISDVYSPGAIVMFLLVGADKTKAPRRAGDRRRPVQYAVFARHGSGGGRAMGGKVNALQRNSEIVPDCDVVIGSHTHSDVVMHDAFYRCDRQNARLVLCERTYVNTPAALSYGGYGETGGYRPNARGHWPVIRLCGSKQLVTVTT